jgi:CubicO group peptidase (beta-lactamase class C family)
MSTSGAPGAVFAIVQGDKIVYQEAFGMANLETKMPTASNTVFAIASVTKFFTALALLTEMESKNLDVNSTVGSIVGGLSAKLSGLTIHHLLSNSAGILGSWPNTNECKDDLLEVFIKAGDKAVFVDQGSVFSYSGRGFALAGLVLAKLSNISYTQAIDSIVCGPLQMSHTTFDLEKAVIHSFAAGHSMDRKVGAMVPTAKSVATAVGQPGGGLFSTIEDLARLAICFMNDGILDGKKLISSEVIRKMSTGYIPLGALRPFLGDPNSTYSYGSFVYLRKGIQYVAHGGDAGNQNAFFVMAPKSKTAFIVLSNTGSHPFVSSVEKAMDLVLPVESEQRVELPDEKLDELVGKYYLPNILGTKQDVIDIVAKGSALSIRISTDKTFSLVRTGEIMYQYSDPNFTVPFGIAFYRDKAGKVKYLNHGWGSRIKIE